MKDNLLTIIKIEITEHREPMKHWRSGFYRNERGDLFHCIKSSTFWYVIRVLTGGITEHKELPDGFIFIDGVITITQTDWK